MIVDTVISDQPRYDDFATLFKDEKVLRVGVKCLIEELERREKARGDREQGMAKRLTETEAACLEGLNLPQDTAGHQSIRRSL